MIKSQKIIVKNISVSFISRISNDYISLTDIARYKNPEEPKEVVKNWIRTRSTIEFLGMWEKINNPNFKGVEFEAFKVALIRKGMPQSDRLRELNNIAITQMKSLVGNPSVKKLK